MTFHRATSEWGAGQLAPNLMDLERTVIRIDRKLEQLLETLATLQPQPVGVDVSAQVTAIIQKLAAIEASVDELKAKKK